MSVRASADQLATLDTSARGGPTLRVAYRTGRGVMFSGSAEAVLASPLARKYRGKVQLILTSPPFPLNRKKKYGNLQGEAYVRWLGSFAPVFREFLKPDGSIVMELGNACLLYTSPSPRD